MLISSGGDFSRFKGIASLVKKYKDSTKASLETLCKI